jgi:hypothetical protein
MYSPNLGLTWRGSWDKSSTQPPRLLLRASDAAHAPLKPAKGTRLTTTQAGRYAPEAMAEQEEGRTHPSRFARWGRQHKRLSASIIVGWVSWIGLVVGRVPADAPDLLVTRVLGAFTVSLLLGLIVYASISFVQRLRAESEMVSAVMYTLTTVALILLSFFVFIWVIKRMWEAA